MTFGKRYPLILNCDCLPIKGRRYSVSAECGENEQSDGECEPCSPSPVTGPGESLLRRTLWRMALFQNLSPATMDSLVQAFQPQTFPAGALLMTEGENSSAGDCFYVIERGTVEFYNNGKLLGTSGPGEWFGELALLYNAPRAATVKAATTLKLWELDRTTFKRVVTTKMMSERELKRVLLRSTDIFQPLSETSRLKLVDILESISFDAKKCIIGEGEQAKYIYMIVDGEAELARNGRHVASLGPGQYFGETTLLYGTPSSTDVIAKTPIKLQALKFSCLKRLLGADALDNMRGIVEGKYKEPSHSELHLCKPRHSFCSC